MNELISNSEWGLNTCPRYHIWWVELYKVVNTWLFWPTKQRFHIVYRILQRTGPVSWVRDRRWRVSTLEFQPRGLVSQSKEDSLGVGRAEATLAGGSGCAEAGSRPCVLPCPHISASPGGPSPADPWWFLQWLGGKKLKVSSHSRFFSWTFCQNVLLESLSLFSETLLESDRCPRGPAAGPPAAARQEEGSWKPGGRGRKVSRGCLQTLSKKPTETCAPPAPSVSSRAFLSSAEHSSANQHSGGLRSAKSSGSAHTYWCTPRSWSGCSRRPWLLGLAQAGWGNTVRHSAIPSPHRRAPCQRPKSSHLHRKNSTPLSPSFPALLPWTSAHLSGLVWPPQEMSQFLGTPPLGHLLCPGSLSRFHWFRSCRGLSDLGWGSWPLLPQNRQEKQRLGGESAGPLDLRLGQEALVLLFRWEKSDPLGNETDYLLKRKATCSWLKWPQQLSTYGWLLKWHTERSFLSSHSLFS